MCEVTPYIMVGIATKRGVSVIYHSTALLISTTGVVYIYTHIIHKVLATPTDVCKIKV